MITPYQSTKAYHGDHEARRMVPAIPCLFAKWPSKGQLLHTQITSMFTVVALAADSPDT